MRLLSGDQKEGCVPCDVLQPADELDTLGPPGDAAYRREYVCAQSHAAFMIYVFFQTWHD